MLTKTPPTPPPADQDLPCSGCAYNLRGLPTTSNCPECGLPIWASVSIAVPETLPLAAADPAYLRNLTRSFAVMLAAAFLAANAPLAQWLLHDDANPRPPPYGSSPTLFIVDCLTHVLVVWSLAAVIGPEPDAVGEFQPTISRRLIGATAIAAVLVPPALWLTRGEAGTAINFLVLGTAILTLLATGAYFWLLGSLAERLPARHRCLGGEAELLTLFATAGLMLASFLTGKVEHHDAFPLIAVGLPADALTLLRAAVHDDIPVAIRIAAVLPAAILLWTAVLLLRFLLALQSLTTTRPAPPPDQP